MSAASENENLLIKLQEVDEAVDEILVDLNKEDIQRDNIDEGINKVHDMIQLIIVHNDHQGILANMLTAVKKAKDLFLDDDFKGPFYNDIRLQLQEVKILIDKLREEIKPSSGGYRKRRTHRKCRTHRKHRIHRKHRTHRKRRTHRNRK